jgi:hypothetical protein
LPSKGNALLGGGLDQLFIEGSKCKSFTLGQFQISRVVGGKSITAHQRQQSLAINDGERFVDANVQASKRLEKVIGNRLRDAPFFSLMASTLATSKSQSAGTSAYESSNKARTLRP